MTTSCLGTEGQLQWVSDLKAKAISLNIPWKGSFEWYRSIPVIQVWASNCNIDIPLTLHLTYEVN